MFIKSYTLFKNEDYSNVHYYIIFTISRVQMDSCLTSKKLQATIKMNAGAEQRLMRYIRIGESSIMIASIPERRKAGRYRGANPPGWHQRLSHLSISLPRHGCTCVEGGLEMWHPETTFHECCLDLCGHYEASESMLRAYLKLTLQDTDNKWRTEICIQI